MNKQKFDDLLWLVIGNLPIVAIIVMVVFYIIMVIITSI
jgi:hypothetical protein